MKVVKLLLLFHQEGEENFTLSVTVPDDKDCMICIVCSTVLTTVVEWC
jgi:hypothetical protein